jgi:hypothetical protein
MKQQSELPDGVTIIDVDQSTKGHFLINNHMQNERTFFKYLFAAFHIGAIGTFTLTCFTNTSKYLHLVLSVVIWAMAFLLMGLSTRQYYLRMGLLSAGKAKSVEALNIHLPTLVVLIVIATVAVIVVTAFLLSEIPSKHKQL